MSGVRSDEHGGKDLFPSSLADTPHIGRSLCYLDRAAGVGGSYAMKDGFRSVATASLRPFGAIWPLAQRSPYRSNRAWKRPVAACVVSVLATLSGIAGGISPAAAVQYPLAVVVNPNPVDKTPTVPAGKVVAIVQMGNTVVVGGDFQSARDIPLKQNLTRAYIFAFDKTTKRISTTFVPQLDAAVTSMAAGPDGASVIVTGKFLDVNGVRKVHIVKLRLSDGSIDPTFAGAVQGGLANSIVVRGNDLYLGGKFTLLTGQPHLGLGAMDATTGAALSWFNLSITQPRQGTPAWVEKIDVTTDESRLVVIGNFLDVGGVARNQIAVIDTSARPAVVTSWDTQAFAGACNSVFDTYMRGLDISPDGSFFAVTTTGSYRSPPSMCDSASSWPLLSSGPNQQARWVHYTGGDTLTAVAVTNAAVYIGGHQRWGNNPYAGDHAGPGAVPRAGLAALDPSTGALLRWNPGRDRGIGVFALVATADTLYIGDDTNSVGNEWHPRFAMFTITGGTPNPQPVPTQLPVVVHRPQTDGSLAATNFDGVNLADAGVTPPGGAIDWTQVRASFYQNGFVYYVASDSSLYKASFDGVTFGTPTNLTAAVGYVVPLYHFDSSLTAMAFDAGRIYYTRSGDTGIYWRTFSLESGIVGGEEKVAYASGASGINGLEIAGGVLYATTTTNELFSVAIGADGSVDWLNRHLIDGAGGSGVQWGSGGDFFVSPFAGTVPGSGTDVCGTGVFTANYYANQSLAGAADTTRCESQINNQYGNGAPAGTGLPADHFSVVWNGSFDFGAGGATTFTTTTDDGVRLFVDGAVVIDQWTDQSATDHSVTLTLTPGVHTVRMEYYENQGSATAQLQGLPA